MHIDRVLLRTIRLPLREPFRASGGVTHERTVLLVHVSGGDGEGVAECVAMSSPHYSPETVESARRMLERYLVPAVLGQRFHRAGELADVLDGAAKGHPMAKAALEMAAWDMEARARGESLASLLGGVRDAVPAGAVAGMAGGREAVLDRVADYVQSGYRRVKLKVAPGSDVELLDAVRAAHPDLPLAVDANGAYSPSDPSPLLALDGFGLQYIEQPFGDDELVAHARLQAKLDTPVCLDETITSPGRCEAALALGSCRVVNVKPGRVGGHHRALAIHDLCRDASVPVWCGGMLETGVGRAHNVALASLPNMRLPGDISASARYWERDIVTPPFELGPDGTIAVPTGAGIGVDLDEDYIRGLELERLELR